MVGCVDVWVVGVRECVGGGGGSMRPGRTSECGLKLPVYEALSYYCMWP